MDHPQLESIHPRVGNWSDAEMWDKEVKNPVNPLGNYMYTMDCMIGTPIDEDHEQVSQCVFDSSTPISSTFGSEMSNYADVFWDEHDSSTYVDYGVTKRFQSIGLFWTGWKFEDTWCLGGGDVHTTVCLEEQQFIQITSQQNPKVWTPPFKSYDNVNTIVGVGKSTDETASYSFLDRAYEAGLLMNNAFTFQGVSVDYEYAHLTIGGYNEADMSSEIDWVDMSTSSDAWMLELSAFSMDGASLMEPPATDPVSVDVAEGSLADRMGYNETVTYPVIAHFNSGYPFLGVDENLFDTIEADL